MSITFLLGGARSGKSAMALELAAATDAPVTFLATATAGDEDMAQRIERHRNERRDDWQTVEESVDLAGALAGVEPTDTVVVDCLTMWVSNLLLDDMAVDVESLIEAMRERPGASIVVSNEVGMGVVPATILGREYRDLLGRVNRAVSLAADRSLLIVAGRLLDLHRPEER